MRSLYRGDGRLAVLVVTVFLILYFMSGFAVTHFAKAIIEENRHNIAGLAFQIDEYKYSLLRGSVQLERVKIFPAGKETDDQILASVDEMYVRISLFSLLREKLHAKKVVLVNPKISYIIEANDKSNWTGVKPIHASIIVDDIKIKNGDVDYRDQRQGMHLELQKVNITVDDIKPAHHDGQLPTSIEFSAQIANTSSEINVTGDASLFGDGIAFDLKGKMSAAPVGLFAAYYRGQVPFPVVGGAVSVAIKANAVDSKFTSTNHVVLTGLRVGGGLEGAVVNKFILSHSGPIVFNVTVSGDLSTGDFSVATGLSKNIAAELVARAAVNAPAAVVKEVGKDVVKPIEKGFKSLFKKR